MRTTEEIIREYECSDPGRRLHLFLDFRDLREEFTEIEQSGWHRETAKGIFKKSYWQKFLSFLPMNSIYKIQLGECCGK